MDMLEISNLLKEYPQIEQHIKDLKKIVIAKIKRFLKKLLFFYLIFTILTIIKENYKRGENMSDDKKKNMYDPKDNFFQDDKTVQKIKKIKEELAEIMIVEEL